MNSLARRHFVLRSTGPHRNLPSHVFRGQRRHIHEPAEKKPVFRWEVRIPPPMPVHYCWSLNGEFNPLRTLWNSRINSLERKSQFGMYDFGF